MAPDERERAHDVAMDQRPSADAFAARAAASGAGNPPACVVVRASTSAPWVGFE